MTSIFVILVLGVIAFAVFAKLKSGGGEGEAGGRYKAKPLLTPNELEFLNRLEQAAPEMRFHCQVGMGALVEPNTSRRENGKEYMRLLGKVSQKRIDFVAQDRATGNIVAIIELDDRTHNGDKDAERDSITADAGFRTIRWQSKSKPSVAEIRAQLTAINGRSEPTIKPPAGGRIN